MKEFELIKTFFSSQAKFAENVLIDIGDDAAVVTIPHGHQLVVTTDTLIENVHFPESTPAYDIGHKALAVNLSDLAAMGATPMWVTLAISLPSPNEAWLKEFASGFFALANRHQTKLIGGDTTQGKLSITVQALGLVEMPNILLRRNAEPNDLIFVSNTLGNAGVGLGLTQGKYKVDPEHTTFFVEKLNRPEPQVELGKQLAKISRCAIDLSDGLISDLQHILNASQVGAEIYLEKIPLSEAMRACIPTKNAIQLALTSGDDYELCFTLNPDVAKTHRELLEQFHCTCIGKITATQKLELFLHDKPYQENLHGYQHFEK